MTQRTILTLGASLLSAATLFTHCNQKPKPDDVALHLRAARHMADSLGIDTTRYASTNPETLEKLLTEIRYGQKPTDQSFSKLPEKIDTAVIGSAMRTADPVAALQAKNPVFAPYKALLTQYNQVKKTATPTQLAEIRQTLNFYRYLNRFATDKFIVVNIPAARLAVYDKAGNRELPMAVIVGKADKSTPRFNCYLTDIVAYPYWNVPQGIAMKEIVPKVQANASYLDSQNMEILDSHDQPVDPESIDWASVSTSNFPYRFRQTSGCHNSLGLIKFTLNGPPAIYFHDTNARQLFDQTTDHWRSHGCVRVEKPVELANFVLGAPKFDQGFYDRCLTDQTPSTFKLPKPFAVFVTYNLADVDETGKLVYYKDVYGLGKAGSIARR
ncbi:L,D-transpeptidase family protein [Fibrella sp. HMF5335]|uniref:L,D-transpeptidase family protein n=1 Tax=Fibrella rubiginis TaxID=2817060 RepID=A0A939K365_9BACT|nr:L,D-transpeptidase family protein [Fibrella rubiginis]MBO0937044.1 L,D-transpeptidase family protein [Fibrella rubiginis]